MIIDFKGATPTVPESVFVAPSAEIIGDVVIGSESSVWFGAVIRGDVHTIRIGARTNIQDNCIVHVTTDKFSTFIGDEVIVGHGAIIHGCHIADRCLIGMGAVVMDGVSVGEGSIIAAGAVVAPGTKIPPRTLWAGVPARQRREVTDTEYESIIADAEEYIQCSRDYGDLGFKR